MSQTSYLTVCRMKVKTSGLLSFSLRPAGSHLWCTHLDSPRYPVKPCGKLLNKQTKNSMRHICICLEHITCLIRMYNVFIFDYIPSVSSVWALTSGPQQWFWLCLLTMHPSDQKVNKAIPRWAPLMHDTSHGEKLELRVMNKWIFQYSKGNLYVCRRL